MNCRYFSFSQRSTRRGKVRNIYEILMMFLVHQLLLRKKLNPILSSHSFPPLVPSVVRHQHESLKFFPRQSLFIQDALQGTFYFKSAKLTQCWFNFAVSWRHETRRSNGLSWNIPSITLPRSSWRWRSVPSWNQIFYWPPVNSSTIFRWGRQLITGVADVFKSFRLSFFLH